MAESTTIVAFDQHAATTVAAVLLPGHRTPALHPMTSALPELRQFVRRLRRQGTVRCCYEASPCGFELQRALTADGVLCDVIAPALIPRAAGRPDQDGPPRRRPACGAVWRGGPDRGASTHRAGRGLARFAAVSRGHPRGPAARPAPAVQVPAAARAPLHGDRAWSRRHDAWLRAQTWPIVALDQTHRAYLRPVDEAVARLRAVCWRYSRWSRCARVERLRCFRGIDDLTALTIAAELGDPRRFPTAPSTMALVGLVPSEHSSGTKRARGAITKTGNAHLRRVLVEAAWHYRHHPFTGDRLRHRQQGAARGRHRQGVGRPAPAPPPLPGAGWPR